VPGSDVLTDRIEEERALPYAGFADDVRMVPAIGQCKRERGISPVAMAHAELYVFVVFHIREVSSCLSLKALICHSRFCEFGHSRFCELVANVSCEPPR
jgi:hypothetical protein